MNAVPAETLPRPNAMPLPGLPHLPRRLLLVTTVIGCHALGLWALQSGLLRRATELVIPVQVLAEMIDAPQPLVEPVRPPAPPAPPPPKAATPRPAPPAPRPIAVADPTPSPSAPTGVIAPEPPPPSIVSSAPAVESVAAAPAAPAAPTAPPAPPAPPRIDLPSSNADYLNNPRPPYHSLSRRLGEQGKVVVRVFIDASGTATQAEVRTSSGYERLDQTALQTVLQWRYVPGKRNGVPEAMWFNVPIHFQLQ